ncbi:uncharacterized protein [Haliotis asinina]|uniref:uncharacterized protein n=1 Tax=Haliotis asinina TaxID=109174 RepID=UPI0035319652
MKMETEEDSDECRSGFSTSSGDEADNVFTSEEDTDQHCSVSHYLPCHQQANIQTDMQRSVQQRGAIVTDGDIIPRNHSHPVVFQKTTYHYEFQSAPRNLIIGEGSKIEQYKRDDKKSRPQELRCKTERNIEQCSKTTVDTYGLSQIMIAIGNGSSFVIVTGSQGDGKTTIAKRAMSKLSAKGKQTFQIFTPDHLSDVGLYISEPVIMLDDICGRINFDNSKWNLWEPALNSLFTDADRRPIVLFVGNTLVLREWSRYIEYLPVKQVSTVDVSQMPRTFQEKESILAALEQSLDVQIDPEKRRQICEWNSHSFLKLCELFLERYKNNNSTPIVSVFRLPTQLEENGVMNVLKHGDKKDLLQKMLENQGELDIYQERCSDKRRDLIVAARNLDGIYLSQRDGVFEFLSEYIHDLVASEFWKLDPRFVIDNCKMTFISRTLRLQSQQPSVKATESLFIPDYLCKYLLARFTTEICQGNIYLALSHTACRWEPFAKQLMDSLLRNNNSSMQTVASLTDATHELTFAYLATSNGSVHILKTIMDLVEPITSEILKDVVFGICDAASVDGLQYLRDKEIEFDINVRNDDDQTPIMVAANTKKSTFVMSVLAINPDVNALDCMGRTVLHYMCENGLARAVKQIACDIADVDRKDKSGRTALFSACEYGHIDIVKDLLKMNACIDVQSLHESCKSEKADILRLLLAEGASVDALSEDGETLLHSACEGGKEVIDLLLQKGLHINKPGFKGRTPLDKAIGLRNETIANYLEEKGGKRNVNLTS